MSDLGSQMAQAFGQANPHMRQGDPALAPQPSATYTRCGAERVIQAGGSFVNLLMHPSFVPFEHLFRKLPNEGVFTATPQKNFKFTLGSFIVPPSMSFCLVDYRFDIYRLNGAVAGDFVPIEERRLSTQIGYDVNIDQFRKGNLDYQLEPSIITPDEDAVTDAPTGGIDASSPFGPIPPQIGNPDFPTGNAPRGATAADFARARSISAASPAGTGTSTLPQRTQRQGALPLPFTVVVEANYRLKFEVIAFRPVPIPLAFFEVGLTGVLLPQNELKALFKGMQPCVAEGSTV